MNNKTITITKKPKLNEGYRGNGVLSPTPKKITPMPKIKPAPHKPQDKKG